MKKKLVGIVLILVSIVIVASSLSVQEMQSAQLRREEEKMAQDLYVQFYEQWGIPTFFNISRSKAKHLESTYDELFEPYGIEDPIKDMTIGVFTNPDIQKMYDEFRMKGMRSPGDAIEVAMMIVEMDLYHRAAGLEFGRDEEFIEVFEHRAKASENHFRSFSNQAMRYGLAYQPRYLPQESVQALLSVEREVMGGYGGQQTFGNPDKGPSGEDCDCDDCPG